MKQLTCKMCGATDLVKQDGVLVCQYCGTKYSVDEAKKTIIDETKKANNYYILAESAFDARNYKEAESYCNKIIEIDSQNYKAWFSKAKATARQAILDKPRIKESVAYFARAINFAPEDKVDDVKKEAEDEMVSCCDEMMKLSCNMLAYDPCIEYKFYVLNTLALYKESMRAFSEQCDAPMKFDDAAVGRTICDAVNRAIMDVIDKDYNEVPYAVTSPLLSGIERCKNCVTVIEDSINQLDLNKRRDIKIGMYMAEDLAIEYMLKIISKMDKYYNHGRSSESNEADKQIYSNKSRIINQRIKELDPEYAKSEIPEPEPESESAPKSKGCYVATAVYGSYDCPQVWTLRRFRDYTLAETWYGRAFIHTYYAISPTLVKWFGETKWFKKMWKGKLDHMVAKLQSKGVESTPYEDREW